MSSPASRPLEGPALFEYLEAVTRGADALVLSGGIAHDLSNALQGLLLARSMTEGDALDPEVQQSLEKVTEQLMEAVTVLRELSRPQPPETRPVIVENLLDSVNQWQRYQKLLPRVPVRFDVAKGLPAVRANEQRVRHALLALITNAKEAVGDPRKGIVVSATGTDGGVAIAVEDDGPGIVPEVRERVFEPFVTTKTEQAHKGLGLAVARLAVEHCGGSLRVESGAGPGARFVVRLPEWRNTDE